MGFWNDIKDKLKDAISVVLPTANSWHNKTRAVVFYTNMDKAKNPLLAEYFNKYRLEYECEGLSNERRDKY